MSVPGQERRIPVIQPDDRSTGLNKKTDIAARMSPDSRRELRMVRRYATASTRSRKPNSSSNARQCGRFPGCIGVIGRRKDSRISPFQASAVFTGIGLVSMVLLTIPYFQEHPHFFRATPIRSC